MVEAPVLGGVTDVCTVQHQRQGLLFVNAVKQGYCLLTENNKDMVRGERFTRLCVILTSLAFLRGSSCSLTVESGKTYLWLVPFQSLKLGILYKVRQHLLNTCTKKKQEVIY